MPKSTKDRANKADDRRLRKMIAQGFLVLTPTRRSDNAPLSFKTFDCSVEDYVVRYAEQREAIIVSRRKFSNYGEASLQEQVEWRVLMYTFSDLEFDPPMDPHGKRGPSLGDFLHFPSCIIPTEKKHEDFSRCTSSGLPKRYIFIDGSNVGHAFTGNMGFNITGVEKAFNYFFKRGHKVKVYLAESTLEKVKVFDQKRLKKLEQEDKVVFTPSRKTQQQMYDCYEDDYIIRNAITNQGIILSNDNFLDMIARSPAYREQIEKRVLPFNFIDGELWLPNDPLGKNEDNLETFLHHPQPPSDWYELNSYI